MVYVYKKAISGGSYYYLRASEKRGNKAITKDIAYLGSSTGEVRKVLGNLPGYKDEIRKAYREHTQVFGVKSLSGKGICIKAEKGRLFG